MKKKGFTLIELLAVIIILALILIIAIPRIMDAVREARIKSFENDVLAIYKTMEKAVHEFELNVPEGREADYAGYFKDEMLLTSQFVNPNLSSQSNYNDYFYSVWDNNYSVAHCPTEFWGNSKTECQYYYDPTIGISSLMLIVEVPKGIQPYYKDKAEQIPNHYTHYWGDVCQVFYSPSWKDFNPNSDSYLGNDGNFPFDNNATGFKYYLCGTGE